MAAWFGSASKELDTVGRGWVCSESLVHAVSRLDCRWLDREALPKIVKLPSGRREPCRLQQGLLSSTLHGLEGVTTAG
jgi:hypothetical protein